MNTEQNQIFEHCLPEQIFAYIDGELFGDEVEILEQHCAVCRECSARLQEQKSFLLSLSNLVSESSVIELPANYSKTVRINAESDISGLKSSKEKSKAILISIGLLVFSVAILGTQVVRDFRIFGVVGTQIGIVANTAAQIIYTFALGGVIVCRSVINHLVSGAYSSFVAVVVASLFGLTVCLIVRRLILTIGHAKEN